MVGQTNPPLLASSSPAWTLIPAIIEIRGRHVPPTVLPCPVSARREFLHAKIGTQLECDFLPGVYGIPETPWTLFLEDELSCSLLVLPALTWQREIHVRFEWITREIYVKGIYVLSSLVVSFACGKETICIVNRNDTSNGNLMVA